ncbi:MFS transporter [Cellulomonas sp. URHE0023]|uniref:MFS transporter n=1 Tax=Cellulomonas sp. URHE0023 TaxID=1380354 RepID=UPI0004896C6B|nr:MFS transporter [Cellulomonas sp. URHE0023]
MQVIADLKALWPLRDFRKLFAVRLVSQAADGMFQVGLATLFFFSPEKASTASGVAIAFAVLLLPFTIVGPWAGVLLDRWRRRQVLFVGNLVRVGLTTLIATIMLTAGVTPAVYVLALANLSVNRFLLSALSASLPRTVDGPLLLTANSLTPTLGAAAAGLGGAVGLVLGFVLPEGRGRDATALIVAACVMATAALLSTRLGKNRLGPDERADAAQLRAQLGLIFRGFVVGARYLIARRTPARALGIMAVHRFIYGVTFIASILIARNLLSDPADTSDGLKTFATILGASALGFFLSVIVTPVVARRTGPQVWIVSCLLLAAASQLLLATSSSRAVVLAAALLLGLAAQGAKIAVDTIVQRDTDDLYRGRAFALYDVLYNAAFVGAAALGALTLPDTGYSRGLFVILAVGYVVSALVFGLASRGVGSKAVAEEPVAA